MGFLLAVVNGVFLPLLREHGWRRALYAARVYSYTLAQGPIQIDSETLVVTGTSLSDEPFTLKPLWPEHPLTTSFWLTISDDEPRLVPDLNAETATARRWDFM